MASVVVDANVLIAARLSRDQNHERGTAIVDAIDLGQLPTAHVYSDVLEEICNYLQARAGHESATNARCARREQWICAHPDSEV